MDKLMVMNSRHEYFYDISEATIPVNIPSVLVNMLKHLISVFVYTTTPL